MTELDFDSSAGPFVVALTGVILSALGIDAATATNQSAAVPVMATTGSAVTEGAEVGETEGEVLATTTDDSDWVHQ